MKLIIAGLKTINDIRMLDAAFILSDLQGDIEEIVIGGAVGVDRLGIHVAKQMGYRFKTFSVNRKEHGKLATSMRNKQMALYGDELLVVWDGKSKTTKNIIDQMMALKKRVHAPKFDDLKKIAASLKKE